MPYPPHYRLADFEKSEAQSVIGNLVGGIADAGHSSLRMAQVPAWQQAIEVVVDAKDSLLAWNVAAANWELIFEYEIPRRGKRPDVVLLADDLIFVIEFKVGSNVYASADRWQALSYALDLHDFHLRSHARTIVPMLVATEAPHRQNATIISDSVSNVQLHNADTLADGIRETYTAQHVHDRTQIDAGQWIKSDYRPSPTIIEAAEALYEHHGVREISHTYADNLTATTDCLVTAIQTAQQERKRLCCFVTGVPGAGKTLAGLNAVHDPELRSEGRPAGVFLSGNSPLVKVVSEALAKCKSELGIPLKERRRHVRTFIQNVHAFLGEHASDSTRIPPEHVVIFDEAQRAWNARMVEKKKGIPLSEPDLLLEIVSRCPTWCVVIALVGGGQEIHDGEAGLAEWGAALARSPMTWEVWASPEALSGGASVAGSCLFETDVPERIPVQERSHLHLHVSVRSQRAQHIAEWVNHVISGNASAASEVAKQFANFPIVLTRDLPTARHWLRQHRIDEHERAGLVTSSGALRHRAYGLEVSSAFRQGFKYEDWFLRDADDSRSSSFLEVAASEFEIQGLEIDWTGVCWGNDFWFDPSQPSWTFQRFSGSKWQRVRQPEKRQFILNKYRVLLTRARKGMVIWVPSGIDGDPTLPNVQFDGTAEFLREAGIQLIEA